MSLTQSFKQNIQDNPTSIAGGVPSNQPMDDKSFNEWIKPTSNTSNSISEAAKSGVEQIKSGYTDAVKAKNPLDLISNSVKAGAGVVNTVLSPLAPITKPIGDAVNALSNKISDIPAVQEFAKSKFGENTSKITDFLNNLNTIAGAVAGVKGGVKVAPKVGEVATKGVETVKNLPETIKNSVKGPEVKQPTFDTNGVKSNIKGDSTPAFDKNANPNIKDAKGNITPRFPESKGAFKTRVPNQTPAEIASDKALSKTPGYGGNTNLEKFNSLQQPLSDNRVSFRKSLESESKTKVTPQKMVYRTSRDIQKATGEKLSLTKQDPTVRNFVNNLIKGSQQVKPNALGVHDLIEKINKVYENAGGKYVGNKSLDTVYKASNDALKGLLNEVAPNTKVLDYFKNQSSLHNASKVLWDKATKEGGSAFDRYTKKHPVIKAAGHKALNLIGVGEVVNHL